MTLPQLLSTAFGAAVCATSLYAFARHRTRRFKAAFWFAIGIAMVSAGFRPTLIEIFGVDSSELRVRLLVGLLSFIVLTVTLEAIRVSRMQERYAFLWLVTGLALLVGAVFPQIARWIAAATGIEYAATVIVGVFAFMLLMLFHFSVALSRSQNMMARITRELALAEERLRQVEAELKTSQSDPPGA